MEDKDTTEHEPHAEEARLMFREMSTGLFITIMIGLLAVLLSVIVMIIPDF